MNISKLKTAVFEKESKLNSYKIELKSTLERLSALQIELDKIPSVQIKIDQIQNKIELLKKIEALLLSYPSTIKAYLQNTYQGTMKDIGEATKDFYLKAASFNISAPILYQFSRSDVLELFKTKGNVAAEETLANSLLNDENTDFAWLSLLYLERYPVVKISKENTYIQLQKIGLTRKEIQNVITVLFKENNYFEFELWELMKPINEWPEHLPKYANYLYESLITNDLIATSINKALKRSQITVADAKQINEVIKDRLIFELPLLLRLNIQQLINKFTDFLQGEKRKEINATKTLEETLREAQRQGVFIEPSLFEQIKEAKQTTKEDLTNYYSKLIEILKDYSNIIHRQASERFAIKIIPYLAKINSLINASLLEQQELKETQVVNNKLQEQNNELKVQINGLNILIQSITNELRENMIDINNSEESLIQTTSNDDEIFQKADNIRNKLTKRIINDGKNIINDDVNDELEIKPIIHQTGISINDIKTWQALTEEKIYWVKNDKGTRTLFLFSKGLLAQVNNIQLQPKFLNAMKNGLVVPIGKNGIKAMKEKQINNYEIKALGTSWRIYGTLVENNKEDVIIFNSFETH